MKQYITKEQWNELNNSEKWKFWTRLKKEGYVNATKKQWIKDKIEFLELPTIGQMIEYLGDNLTSLIIEDGGNNCFIFYHSDHNKEFGWQKGVCNILWKVVKYKLK